MINRLIQCYLLLPAYFATFCLGGVWFNGMILWEGMEWLFLGPPSPKSPLNGHSLAKFDTPVTHELELPIRRHKGQNLVGFPWTKPNTRMESHVIQNRRICKRKSQIGKAREVRIHLNFTIYLAFHQDSIPEQQKQIERELALYKQVMPKMSSAYDCKNHITKYPNTSGSGRDTPRSEK